MYNSQVKVSVIIPCFNAVDKIGRCLASLRNIDMPQHDFEVIFIDDCSTDGTFTLLEHECTNEANWRVEKLLKNSGSPSRPRNHGLALATGEYVFFLDCDDEIFADTLKVQYNFAVKKNADVVRAYLVVDDGRSRRNLNQLKRWSSSMSRTERIEAIFKEQSLTKTCFFRSALLRKTGTLFPEDMKMGEDVVFVAEAISAAETIDYIDHPTYIYYTARSLVASTTQSFGAKELRDQLLMWPRLEKSYASVGIDYVTARLHVNLRYIISLLKTRNRFDIDKDLFLQFSKYISPRFDKINLTHYSERDREFIKTVAFGKFQDFCFVARPRLVIAGYDLKFITSALPELQEYFDVRLDEWTGHAEHEHDESKSRELLDWAELIWCEWLLGNAVWYSAHKKPHQRLIARMHRFELSQDFGENLKIENVDAVTAVSVHFFERLLERYPNIPRAKARLLPNFIRTDEYDQSEFNEQRLFTLGMIGILPARKRLDRALNILAKLRQEDSRYRLEIFGKRPEELHWIASNKEEMAYFKDCYRIISEHNLEEAVTFHGHTDLRKALARNHVGFVLSTSESMHEFPGFESFHLAVADAFAGGGIGVIQHWLGAEYVWPKDFILSTEDEIKDYITSFKKNQKYFQETSEQGHIFIRENYGINKFAASVKELFSEIS